MRYRFKIPHRQFHIGDLVPEAWDAGMVSTLLQVHRIEPVADEPEAKRITAPPADKKLHAGRVRQKAGCR
jgi:hypothetical protein